MNRHERSVDDNWHPIGEAEANIVHHVIARLVDVDDEPSATELLAAAVGALNADAAQFASLIQYDASLVSYRVLHACDPVWASQYAANRWYLSDPWLHYALYNAEPVRSEDLQGHTDPEHEVAQAAKKVGFVHTLIVPAPSTAAQSRTGVLCIGSRSAGFFHPSRYPALRGLSRSLAMELGDWMQRHLRAELVERAHITDEDHVLLRHEQQGHSSKVIAVMLHTEPKTIDCRFQRLCLRMGTANRKAAVRVAEILGLI